MILVYSIEQFFDSNEKEKKERERKTIIKVEELCEMGIRQTIIIFAV